MSFREFVHEFVHGPSAEIIARVSPPRRRLVAALHALLAVTCIVGACATLAGAFVVAGAERFVLLLPAAFLAFLSVAITRDMRIWWRACRGRARPLAEPAPSKERPRLSART